MNNLFCTTTYTYRICVPDERLVRVQMWDCQNQSPTEASGKFRREKLTDEIKALIETTRNAPLKEQLNDSEQIRLLGEALFDVLFDKELSQHFIDCYRRVVVQQVQRIRIELEIDEEFLPDIAALPWEFMCVPKRYNAGNIWLATNPELVFLRRPKQSSAATLIQLNKNEKLKIALVVSKPSDLGEVQSYSVQKALEDLTTNQLAEKIEFLPVINPASPQKINDLLVRKPHIFHFIGHGRLQKENNKEVGQIAFVNEETSEADWRNADFFSGLFNRHRPQVVILQACEGAKQSESEAFVSVASSLVNQNIPIVVAMQYEVSNNTAIKFARSFYKQIAKSQSVDIAVQESRHELSLSKQEHKTRDFATPVIYMSVSDGNLFEFSNLKSTETITRLEKVILLRDKFLMCRSILDPAKRKRIILNLRPEITSNSILEGDNNTVMQSVIETSLDYQGGLLELLKTTEILFERNSIQMKDLWESAQKLFPEEVAE
jgi:hypothetical protein